ncbi:hypothetical protein FB451DRAFT_1437849 [Mycena latifolia]|nr:hypothetical protein FB451DRAFT_1437849 [Mycena latifolia]
MTLEVLRKGLASLKENFKKRRDELAQRLKKEEKISEVDEAWLNNDANHVDEDVLIDTLENASDYECGLSRLDSKQKRLVQKLQELAGGMADDSRKQKVRNCGGVRSRFTCRGNHGLDGLDNAYLEYLSHNLPRESANLNELDGYKRLKSGENESQTQGMKMYMAVEMEIESKSDVTAGENESDDGDSGPEWIARSQPFARRSRISKGTVNWKGRERYQRSIRLLTALSCIKLGSEGQAWGSRHSGVERGRTAKEEDGGRQEVGWPTTGREHAAARFRVMRVEGVHENGKTIHSSRSGERLRQNAGRWRGREHYGWVRRTKQADDVFRDTNRLHD